MANDQVVTHHLPEYTHPVKLVWLLPELKPGQDWTTLILSKSLAKLARKCKQVLSDAQVEFVAKPLTSELYQTWHTFYAESMTSLGHSVLAQPDWFERKKATFKNGWLLSFEQHGKMVGGSIVSESPEGLLGHHYKASDRLELSSDENASLGSLMELVYLDFAFSQNPTQVSSGSSRNGFGFYNSVGYLTSKLRIGYVPTPSLTDEVDQIFLSTNQETPTVWVALNAHQEKVVILYPSPEKFNSELLTYLERANLTIVDYQNTNHSLQLSS